MLTDRIIGAFTFRSGVYAEVEKDTTFTNSAWLIVLVVGFLNQLGAAATANPVRWLLGAIGGTIFAVIGFAVAAYIISWVGRTLYEADVTFEEMVRTLGLAYVWNVIGIFGVVTAFSDLLSCLLAPVVIAAVILLIIAWLTAAKEALDLEWTQTIVTIVAGWLAFLVIMLIGGAVLGLFGLGAAAMGGLFL